ncbi:MAG TPA: hypothetical protein DCX53_08615 [Anaerolineae bacterium]|nr:hypothetical protein [Anaerolineae bacterium]
MWNLFKKKPAHKPVTIRDTLFGDLPASEWPRDDTANAEPWSSFVKARQLLEKGDKSSAVKMYQTITDMTGLEPRHYLQAWHFLRQLGVNPPADKAKIVYGMVVEVGMPKGADIVAAYTNFTARYLNFTGAGEIWERPDQSLDDKIKALLDAGENVVKKIGPWEEARPPAPTNGNVRLNMLTPSGLHFGYGSFQTLSNEPMGKAIIDPATELMVALTKLAKKK